jgi:Actin-like ATPase involved in cell division
MLVVERCHLNVEAMAASPYVAGLSVLTDDEADLGAAVVEMGAGTTTIATYSAGASSMPADSRSAAITSPWTLRAASVRALRMPSESRRYMAAY